MRNVTLFGSCTISVAH